MGFGCEVVDTWLVSCASMDDIEDNGRYPSNPYGMNQGYESSNRQKLPVHDPSYSRHVDNHYEFAPRVPPPSTTAATAPKPSFGGRNPLSDWSENETFILLDAWGTRFVRHGRKSLRSEEWQEVADRVSRGSKIERTDTQCRNRLDTLKKKYKKEKMKFAETGSSTSKWVYFKKMDMLLTSTPQKAGVSCGMDSGEYVFMSPKAYLNRANGLDEMRDSPANSESADGEEDGSEDLPPKRSRNVQPGGNGNGNGHSFKLIADSIHKFSEIYVKIENSKRQQMMELEKMRMDFHRELELQKRQIMERAQAEIARIRQGSDEENDMSAENNLLEFNHRDPSEFSQDMGIKYGDAVLLASRDYYALYDARSFAAWMMRKILHQIQQLWQPPPVSFKRNTYYFLDLTTKSMAFPFQFDTNCTQGRELDQLISIFKLKKRTIVPKHQRNSHYHYQHQVLKKEEEQGSLPSHTSLRWLPISRQIFMA
uniref:Myb-like domain-containing protein n=1 Tax=Solanum lycopersicum TaxID=4081 RepID=A0A3Q7J9R0_SOLLC